jgi:biopolymer transport protein ExbD
MHLRRARPLRPLISLVSMVDVLLIMLIFFMVTSTYLDLDMLELAEPAEEGAGAASAPADTVLVSIGGDGQARLGGATLAPAALTEALSDRLAAAPGTQVLLLPSALADTQALVRVMDAAARAGATRLRIVQLEPQR